MSNGGDWQKTTRRLDGVSFAGTGQTYPQGPSPCVNCEICSGSRTKKHRRPVARPPRALGRGTQVLVFLPRVEGEPETARAPVRQDAQVSGAGTVLVVEDEELVRRSLYDILEGTGYRVLQARNAREAMLISRGYGGAIDLMLTDLVLPGMNGPELAEKLRPLRPAMQVLYMSGYRDDARVRRLEQVGKAFFPKPFSAAAIAAKVSEVLAVTPQPPGRAS